MLSNYIIPVAMTLPWQPHSINTGAHTAPVPLMVLYPLWCTTYMEFDVNIQIYKNKDLLIKIQIYL